MTDETENKLEAISKHQLYIALTGSERGSHHPRCSQFSGHPLAIDTHIDQVADHAYLLCKKMQRGYEQWNDKGHLDYFGPCIKSVEDAYLKGDSDKMNNALQTLIDVIFME